ncbi:caspase family protein [Microcoleus sp. S13_C5]|uniref:caspase family protein n=1 Tax=Microcoleus sp. S13_C5 TaxID=3055411 RepID=UPI002FD34ED5
MSKKKALVIGINDYPSPNSLFSCVNDAKKFSALLTENYGFSEICNRFDTEATIDNIRQDLKWLFQDVQPDDRLVFYYSGHGYQAVKDGVLKDCLVLYPQTFFFGNELSAFTQNIPTGIFTLVLDSCFSGGMEKAFLIAESGQEIIRVKSWSPPDEQLRRLSIAQTDRNIDYQPFGQPVIRSNLPFRDLIVSTNFLRLMSTESNSKPVNGLLMSACKADEKAAADTPQTQNLSTFTFCLLQAISSIGTTISNNNLLTVIKEYIQKIGLTQTPTLVEPPEPKGLASESFLNLEPTGKNFVLAIYPEKVNLDKNQNSIRLKPAIITTIDAETTRDKQKTYDRLKAGVSYANATGYCIHTLKELLSDLQPVNYKWLIYNPTDGGSWSASISGNHWGTGLAPIEPSSDEAYTQTVVELSEAIQIAKQLGLLLDPYTHEAMEELILRVSEAIRDAAIIPYLIQELHANLEVASKSINWDTIEVYLINKTSRKLLLATAHLEHGEFTSEPKSEIPKIQDTEQQLAFIGLSRDLSLVGVKGTVEYNTVDESDQQVKLRIEFDIPSIGSNFLIATLDGTHAISYKVYTIKGGDWTQSSGTKKLTAVILFDYKNP